MHNDFNIKIPFKGIIILYFEMMDFNLATWLIQAHSIYKHEKQQLTEVSVAHNAFESLSRLQQKQMSLKKVQSPNITSGEWMIF